MTYEKFSIAPVKLRILYIKHLLNELGYNVSLNFLEDKEYKKALKDYQTKNNFIPNCVISNAVFYSFMDKIPTAKAIWKSLK